MLVEEIADLILLKLSSEKVLQRDIHFEVPNYYDAIQLLRREGYISEYYWPAVSKERYYQIEPKGKQLYENGGFKAIRDYNQIILDTAKSSKTLSLWAIGIAVLSILVSLILWIAGRGK